MTAGRIPTGQLTKSGILSVSVPSLPQLELIPGEVAEAPRRFQRLLGIALVDDIRHEAPRRTGRLAASFAAHRLNDTSFLIGALQGPGRLYARAVDRGSYRRASGGGVHVDGHARALRFSVAGGVAFSRFTRIKPNLFFERSLQRRYRIGQRVYEQTFGNLGGTT